MNKRKLITVLWSGITFTCLASGLLASIAWFASANKFDVDITGSVVEEYFHCGDGTAGPDDPSTPNVIEGPFVITRPIHYYHLVEFFQRETALDANAEFGSDYLYFQVGYDLDGDGDLEVYDYDDQGIYQGTYETPSYSQTLNMAYYSGNNALMPIGTNEVPFIGIFDGKADEGITVSNLNIHCAETVVVGNNTVNRAASDIGIFGYVADSDGTNPTIIENLKVNGLTIDLTDVTSTVASSTTSIAHTDAHAGVAYVGYIVGHVHSYTNYSSTGPVNATPLHDVYVTNATITGGAGTSCGFGYIGLVDTVDGEEPTTVESQVTTTHGSGGGQGDEWGGSIAFDYFNQRLRSKLNGTGSSSIRFKNGNTTYSNGLIKTTANNDSAITVFRGGTASNAETYLAKDPASNFVVYNMIGSGTHSINNKSNGSNGTTYTATASVDGTYEPLIINGDYTAADRNTGYITSSQYAQNGSSHYYSAIDGTVRSASYPNGQLANSINDTHYETSALYNASTGGPLMTYNGNKLEILTNGTASYSASNYRLVSDDYNSGHTVSNSSLTGYTKTNYETLGKTRYESAREHLEQVLTGSQYVHGIHFMGEAPASNKTVSVPHAMINGEAKTNYPVLLSSIDFTVKEEGYITLFAGSYYPAGSSTVADSFFDLFKVTRNGNNISSIQKVYKIYKDADDNYTYTTSANQTVSNATLMFDMAYLYNQPPKNNVVYYFEIPVDAGEYAIGAVSGKTAGAYLMYLDIGTSGEEQQQTHNQTISVANASLFSQIDFQIDAPVTNSCFNVAFVIPTGATKETFSVTISSGSVVYNGEDYFCYEIVIVNTTQNDFTISALLMDDDDDPENDFYYMYAIKYNTGARTEYTGSNTYTGVSGGTSMTPTYTQSQQQGD